MTLSIFYVPLEKNYIRDYDRITLHGHIPIKANSQDEARAVVEVMLNRFGSHPLQTNDPRIEWDDKHPKKPWIYEDFSFGIPEDAESDWTEKPF